MRRINEIESKDISLSSFKIKKELNPKFWPNGKLNSRVRLRLLDIADDFVKDLAVDWVKPKDIIFTGSIANYNWSRYSDVDIHILFDFKKVYPKNSEFVEDYFKSKKENWSSNHEDLKIFGFPIEISVEDSNENNESTGRYSLYKNKWVVEPNDFQDAVINQDYVKKRAATFITQIDDIEKKLNNESDTYKCEKYGDKVYKIFDKLKTMRTEGLASDKKEMSSGNIIYKIMRRAGYIDKIWEIYNSSYDKANSITERKEINEAQTRGEKFSAGIIPFRMNKDGQTEVFLGLPGKPKTRGFKAPQWMTRWQILKGHMENGEDPIECAVREFSEESGIPQNYLPKNQLINLGAIPMDNSRKLVCYGIDLTDSKTFDTIHFHSNLIDSHHYIALNHGKPYPEIEAYNWKKVGEINNAKSYENEFYNRCNKICKERYKNA
jgi:predicted NUDIX family NTP pyrophosphohydrolase/predicted nucleotidyltransferase